ncbi:MAG: hypothetical protein WCI66_10350 [Gammaproteobacteria bacterium]|jgi:hypothetical protein
MRQRFTEIRDSLRMLASHRSVWLNATGSGNQTAVAQQQGNTVSLDGKVIT